MHYLDSLFSEVYTLLSALPHGQPHGHHGRSLASSLGIGHEFLRRLVLTSAFSSALASFTSLASSANLASAASCSDVLTSAFAICTDPGAGPIGSLDAPHPIGLSAGILLVDVIWPKDFAPSIVPQTPRALMGDNRWNCEKARLVSPRGGFDRRKWERT